MSYEEKGTWVDLLIAVGGIAAYLVVIMRRAEGGSLATVDYVGPLLWTIGLSALATAVGRAAVAIASAEGDLADVRDQVVGNRGELVGQWPLTAAALTAMAMAMARWDTFWIANTIAVGFYAAAVLSAVVRLVAYRRGVW